ncbi:pyridoxamine 5'-phosphate oxidase family protein [Rhodovulum euryhalinum]|uniref:Pyridoxamine 5'-phosphate oxidase n=1 Tax=Rhodovulum euryhalinum TaxID=35805 RepID=A0A4R2KKK2_9RHOB|nr:pyridoxamine 5'-phosphate oxidase family protein [Rhodovulum euryhalinum]TCO74193.1 pyridoxamine 5'-phosphate oxidase [Rhodovulum euryhalinum]
MTDPLTTLSGTLDTVWTLLARGATDRDAPARHPVLATSGRDGAEARMVVLREARRDPPRVEIFADRRSAKVSELSAEPRASLLVWDPALRLQVRLRARFQVLAGEAVAPLWQALPGAARALYGGRPAPGAPIPEPGDHIADPAAHAFCVLRGVLAEIETLHLATLGHRRALFRATDDWQGGWCAP